MYKRPYNPHTRYYLRGLAGLYLLYLAWSLRPELTKPGLMKFAPILFALIGLAFSLSAAYSIFWKDTPTEEPEESPAEEDSADENDPALPEVDREDEE